MGRVKGQCHRELKAELERPTSADKQKSGDKVETEEQEELDGHRSRKQLGLPV